MWSNAPPNHVVLSSLLPSDRHLEKTPIQYIQWRFQDGHDREILEKATRVLTEEEKAQLEVPFVGKNGTTRKLEVCPIFGVADLCR